jgi:type I restriction enzyme S subunit
MMQQKMMPVLRFAPFADEWVPKKLGELLEFKNGINATKEQYGSGFKFINVLDILNNDFITYDRILGSVQVDEETAQKFAVEYGDILFQRSSETRAEVGTANVYLDPIHRATFGGFVIRGRKVGAYEPIFLNKLLQTEPVRTQITSKSGGSTRYNVGQEILTSVLLALPSFPEQQKIASFFAAIDTRIAQLQKQQNLLDAYKKGVMQQIFTQKWRFQPENGTNFPDWEVQILGKLGTFFSGGTPLTSKKEYFNGKIPFIRSGEIHSDKTEQFLTEAGFQNSAAKKVEVGDLLYALYGATSGEVGISKIKGAINQALLCIRTNLETRFLAYYLFFQKDTIVNTYLQGGQGNLSAEIIKALEIPCPSLAEQKQIGDFLHAIDERLHTVRTQIAQTQAWKNGLLQRMFV